MILCIQNPIALGENHCLYPVDLQTGLIYKNGVGLIGMINAHTSAIVLHTELTDAEVNTLFLILDNLLSNTYLEVTGLEILRKNLNLIENHVRLKTSEINYEVFH